MKAKFNLLNNNRWIIFFIVFNIIIGSIFIIFSTTVFFTKNKILSYSENYLFLLNQLYFKFSNVTHTSFYDLIQIYKYGEYTNFYFSITSVNFWIISYLLFAIGCVLLLYSVYSFLYGKISYSVKHGKINSKYLLFHYLMYIFITFILLLGGSLIVGIGILALLSQIGNSIYEFGKTPPELDYVIKQMPVLISYLPLALAIILILFLLLVIILGIVKFKQNILFFTANQNSDNKQAKNNIIIANETETTTTTEKEFFTANQNYTNDILNEIDENTLKPDILDSKKIIYALDYDGLIESYRKCLTLFEKQKIRKNSFFMNFYKIYKSITSADNEIEKDFEGAKNYLVNFVNSWSKKDNVFIKKISKIANQKTSLNKYAWKINNLILKYNYYLSNLDLLNTEIIIEQIYIYGLLTKKLLFDAGKTIFYKIEKFYKKIELKYNVSGRLENYKTNNELVEYANFCIKVVRVISPVEKIINEIYKKIRWVR